MDKSRLEELFDEEYKIATLQEEFKKDCLLPKEINKLSTVNLENGLLLNKWITKYTRTEMKVKELEYELEKLENRIKQKCRHDPSFNGHKAIDKHEMIEKINIDEDYIAIKTKVIRLDTIRKLLLSYVEYFKYRNSHVQNQIEIIKLSTLSY